VEQLLQDKLDTSVQFIMVVQVLVVVQDRLQLFQQLVQD
jgi:hypothetical protein